MGKTAAATAAVVRKATSKAPLKIVPPTAKAAKPSPMLLRSETVMCTPAIAKQLRAACHFERQRTLSDSHIARLAEEMQRGSFVAGTQVFIGVLPSRDMKILNGNHTLEAVVFSGIPTPLTFTYCPIADENDAGRLYAQFDIHRSRSWGDAYKAYGFEEEIPAEWLRKAGAAVAIIAAKFNRPDTRDGIFKSRDVRSQMMREYAETTKHFIAAINGAEKGIPRLLQRRAVLAVALETMRWQPSASATFWGAVARNDGLKSGDPAKALLTHLRNYNAGDGGNSGLVQANAASSAWNAFYEGKALQFVRPKELTNFRLAGTPWVDAAYDPAIPLADKSFQSTVQVDAVEHPSFSTGMSFGQDGDKVVVQYENQTAA